MLSPTGGRWTRAHIPCVLSCILLCQIVCGCVSDPYRYGSDSRYYTSEQLAAITGTQIERGRPRPFLDGLGWVIGIPDKILLWNRRIDNHNVSPETEQAIADYLAKNELTTVKVRLNQYAPGSDWHRLVANKSVGWGWRYTLGTASWLAETVLPGRVIGGDHYNPFTNTVHIYSDVPAIAIHEGGHAKDFARRYYKGTYAAGYLLPVTPLWYEAIATNDAVSYLRAEGTVEDEQAADRILYPAYGTYVGYSISTVVPWAGTPFYLAGVVGGHVAGRVQARRLPTQRSASIQPANYEAPSLEDREAGFARATAETGDCAMVEPHRPEFMEPKQELNLCRREGRQGHPSSTSSSCAKPRGVAYFLGYNKQKPVQPDLFYLGLLREGGIGLAFDRPDLAPLTPRP